MKKSRFVEYTTMFGANGSFHVDTVIYFEGSDGGVLVRLSNGNTILTAEPYETIKERINEAMQ